MPVSDVTPNVSYFTNLLGESKQANVAKRLRISIGTLRTLLQGNPVSRTTMEQIAERLSVPIGSIIETTKDRYLPVNPQFYESLQHGYYLDHDRKASGTVRWWRETISIKTVASPQDVGGVHFSGTVTNQFSNCFQVHGLLTNQFHFSITGTHHLVSSNELISFDAASSQQISGVLCGTWSGINHFASASTLYRIFLSKEPLSQSEIQNLARSAKVEIQFESSDFGFTE